MELQLTPQTLPSVEGNFDVYKADVQALIDGFKGKPLTEETVAPVKSAIRQMRTTLEKYESTSIGMYFETPKKLLKAKFAELYAIIAEGENKVDAVIAEDTRKRNEELTDRLTKYIKSKIKDLAVESDVVDYVILHKAFFNKTAKEAETLDNIDTQLLQLEKNFAAFTRATKKVNKFALVLGGAFNKGRYLYSLEKYGDGNDSASILAEEEHDRLIAVPETPTPTPTPTSAPVRSVAVEAEEACTEITVDFPHYEKKTSKGTDELAYSFTVPKEQKKAFAELLKELKAVGIKYKKNI